MRLFRLAAVLVPLASPALGQTLKLGTGGSATSLDPHFFNASPNSALTQHIFDRLVRPRRARPASADAGGNPGGGRRHRLGVQAAPRRAPGRRSPFTADDVAFTSPARPNVPKAPAASAASCAHHAGGGGGPATAALRHGGPNRCCCRAGSVAVVSRHAGEGAATEDYNAGRAAIGTGPYRLAAYRPGDRTELARNEAYWAGRSPGSAWRTASSPTTRARTAALLAGDVDLIDQVPPTDLPRLRRDAALAVSEMQGAAAGLSRPRMSRRGRCPSSPITTGQPLAANPLPRPCACAGRSPWRSTARRWPSA